MKMTDSVQLDSTQRAILRKTIADRIRCLRKEKVIWSPGAPRADLRCRRELEDFVIATRHSPCDLAELVEAANEAGYSDLSTVVVRTHQQSVPYEDYTLDLTELTISQKLSDESFAVQIGALWLVYLEAQQHAAGRFEDYQTFLRLKQVFEPN